MSVLSELRDLKDYLLKTFEDKIKSGETVSQPELEKAIEDHQGCDFNTAKYLINLLWEHHGAEMVRIYKLVDVDSGLSIEIKDTIKQAHRPCII